MPTDLKEIPFDATNLAGLMVGGEIGIGAICIRRTEQYHWELGARGRVIIVERDNEARQWTVSTAAEPRLGSAQHLYAALGLALCEADAS